MSNPNPFRFFQIIIILALFFSIATVFAVLLVLFFVMVTGFKHPR